MLYHTYWHIEYIPLCYTVGPCFLPILYLIVGICWSQSLNPSLPLPLGNHSLFSMSVSLFLFGGYVHLCRILDSTDVIPESICVSLSDLLCLVWKSLGPSMLLQMASFLSFLRLSNILYLLYHLSCFHVTALTSSTAMSIGVHVSFRIRLLSGYMPKTKWDFWMIFQVNF